jgi:hypothetical protein
MKGMHHHRLFLLLIMGVALSSFIPLAATAQSTPTDDVALTISVSPSDTAITEGTEVDVIITITNVGTESTQIDMPDTVLLPPELTYVDLSYSWETGLFTDTQFCDDLGVVSESGYNIYSTLSSHRMFNCYSMRYLNSLLVADPGESKNFTLHTVANQDWTDGTTSVVAVHEVGPQESASVPSDDVAYFDLLDLAVDPAQIDSNNVDLYVYDAPTVTTTTTTSGTSPGTGGSSQDSSDSTTSDSETLAAGVGSDGTAAADGDSLLENSASDDPSDKVEVAQDLETTLPDRISRDDNNAWETLLAGGYKYQIAGFVLALIIAASGAYVMRRRYLTKVEAEKAYRKALKVRALPEKKSEDEKVKQPV